MNRMEKFPDGLSPALFETAIDDVLLVLGADEADPRGWAGEQLLYAAKRQEALRDKLLTDTMLNKVPDDEKAYNFRQAALRLLRTTYRSDTNERNRAALLDFWMLLPACEFEDEEQERLGHAFRDQLLTPYESDAWWAAYVVILNLTDRKIREVAAEEPQFVGGYF